MEETDGDEDDETEHLDDADDVAGARRRLDAHEVEDAEERDERDDAGDESRLVLAPTDEEGSVLGEAARHRRVAEQRRDHGDPADGEADQRAERLEGVAVRAARAIGARRRLREAKRDQCAQTAHYQPCQRRMAARPSLQRRRQQEDPGAEDAVDAQAEAVDQRELARMTSYEPTLPVPRRAEMLRRVGLLGALLAGGCAGHAACKTNNDHCGEFTRPNDSRREGAPRCRQGFFQHFVSGRRNSSMPRGGSEHLCPKVSMQAPSSPGDTLALEVTQNLPSGIVARRTGDVRLPDGLPNGTNRDPRSDLDNPRNPTSDAPRRFAAGRALRGKYRRR